MSNNYPKNVKFFLTEECNMKCAFCPHAIHQQSDFRTTNFNPYYIKDIIVNSDSFLIVGDGEPLLLFNFLDYIPEQISFNCNFIFQTSGIPLTETIIKDLIRKKITYISFSIDAGDKKTYEKIRGPYWDQLWKNIKKTIERRKNSR